MTHDTEPSDRRSRVLRRTAWLVLIPTTAVLCLAAIHNWVLLYSKQVNWQKTIKLGIWLLLVAACCVLFRIFTARFSRKTVLARIGLAILMLDALVLVYVSWVYDPGYGDWAGFELLPLTGICIAMILLALVFSVAGLALGDTCCGAAGIAGAPLLFLFWVWAVKTGFFGTLSVG